MNALEPRDLIGVIGAGTMGAGIAQVAADFGHRVKLYDLSMEAVERGVAGVRRGLQKLVARGRKSEHEVEQLLARIHPSSTLTELANCKLVIEVVVEERSVKQEILRQLEKICADTTILATNTSSISITDLGTELARPQNLVGMHFFNPAPVMKLVEVISAPATSEAVTGCVFDTAANWGKMPVHARNSPGFIANRVARAFYAEPLQLLEEDAAGIATLDALFRGVGFPLGPFELMDLIGNDVNYAVTESVFHGFDQHPRFQPSPLQKELVANGRLGRKSGRGWYDYGDDNRPQADIVGSDFRPRAITVFGDLGATGDLIALAQKAGMTVSRAEGEAGILVEDTLLALTDGRTAALRGEMRERSSDQPDLVLFDLLASYTDDRHIAVATAPQTGEQSLRHAAGFFNALGKTVSKLSDVPGLCLMRTVCRLANEGADAVHQGVCEAAAVDVAMRFGLNHPRGPLRWADAIGLARVRAVIDNLHRSYRSERYRCSPLIERKVDAGETFHS